MIKLAPTKLYELFIQFPVLLYIHAYKLYGLSNSNFNAISCMTWWCIHMYISNYCSSLTLLMSSSQRIQEYAQIHLMGTWNYSDFNIFEFFKIFVNSFTRICYCWSRNPIECCSDYRLVGNSCEGKQSNIHLRKHETLCFNLINFCLIINLYVFEEPSIFCLILRMLAGIVWEKL